MRAAIYARVSTDDQAREGTSLDSQIEESEVYAAQRGYQVVIRVKEQFSASRDIRKRTELQRLLQQARAGEFDVLLVHNPSRFTRDASGEDEGWLRTEFRWAGVRVEVVTGSDDPIHRMFATYTSGEEAKNNSERIRRARRTTAQQGRYIPGYAPYGYRHKRALIGVPPDQAWKVIGLEVNPETAPVAREIFDALARGGTAWGIANELNRRGVLPSRGTMWRHTSIISILENPTFMGEPTALRYEFPRDWRTRERRSRMRPVEGHVKLPTEVAPALVSPDVWQRANEQVAANRTGARRTAAEPELYLLRAGFIRCGYCDRVVGAERVGGQPYYRCKQTGCRERGSVRSEELDGVVWDLMEQVLRHPDWIRGQLQEQADDSLGARVDELQKHHDDLVAREARLTKNLELLDDPSSIIPQINALAAQRMAAQQELAGLLHQQLHAVEMAERMKGLDARFLQEWDRLDALAYDERRAKLREFNVGVTLWKRDHEPRYAIDWAFDLSAWDRCDQEEEPWVIYTRESSTPTAPLVNSSV